MHQEDEISESGCKFVVQMKNDNEMNKVPEIDEKQLGGNPYVYKLQIPVTEITKVNEFQENVEGVLINKVLYAEKTKKVEVYIHETSRDNVAQLSDKAQRMYLHILYTIKRSKDWVYLNKEFYMTKNKVKSITTYLSAIKELHRYEFIQPSAVKGVYWINPYRFFPGNRVVKYPNNLKIEGKWDQTKEEGRKQSQTTKKSVNLSQKSQMEEQEEKVVSMYTNDV